MFVHAKGKGKDFKVKEFDLPMHTLKHKATLYVDLVDQFRLE